jgi:hypothetical protein
MRKLNGRVLTTDLENSADDNNKHRSWVKYFLRTGPRTLPGSGMPKSGNSNVTLWRGYKAIYSTAAENEVSALAVLVRGVRVGTVPSQ